MYKIALTGGIGTGKTYLSKQFVQMGIPVFYADDEAKKIYQDPKVRQSLCQVFGTEILFLTAPSTYLSYQLLSSPTSNSCNVSTPWYILG